VNKYEIESWLKSFALFFVLMTSIYALFLYQSFSRRHHELDTQILQQMRIFSFDPTSGEFDLTFVPHDANMTLLALHHDSQRVYAYFTVPTEDDFLMVVSLPIAKYQARVEAIRSLVRSGAVWYLLLIALFAFGLAYYSLHPIRRAMHLNKEFIRDILHDVNTPIASIAVNLKMLQKKFGEHRAFDRIWNNIETIGVMRENLHAYLGHKTQEKSSFDLRDVLVQRLEYFRVLYPSIQFESWVPEGVTLHTERNSFVRIIDNLLSNAAKYNKPNGSVRLEMEGDTLIIQDTGKGIRHPNKAFLRHYKEGERGMGLGLHIVWQLCRELGIEVALESTIGTGTSVKLDCTRVREK
jgi:signal transduction histidine kinase